MTFEEGRNRFRYFYEVMKKMHTESSMPENGHGLDHDVTVAALAVRIAPDERTAEKAWVAAMLHSIDRHVAERSIYDALNDRLGYLPRGSFDDYEITEIFRSVLRHAELNQDDQSLTQQVLMDADRLANIMLSVVMRAGQCYPKLLTFEFGYLDDQQRNPASTWNKPCSVLDNVRGNYQLLQDVRMPKAKVLRDHFASRLSAFVEGVEKQYRVLGLAGISL